MWLGKRCAQTIVNCNAAGKVVRGLRAQTNAKQMVLGTLCAQPIPQTELAGKQYARHIGDQWFGKAACPKPL